MKTTHFLLAASLLLAPCVTAHAQADPSYLEDSQLELHRYSPSHVDPASLYETLNTLFGRNLRFENRGVFNLAVLEESLVIYETPERMERILRAIEQLDIDPNAEDAAEEKNNALTASQVAMQSYLPRYIQAAELYNLANELYGRTILVEDDWHDNLRLTQHAILIYEEKSAAARLLENLAQIDQSQAQQQSAPLEVLEYQPRHISPEGLMQGLQPFRALVEDLRNGTRNSAINLTLLEERGTILIRDYPERAQEILQALERLDQPAPQVMVVCQVLRGIDSAAERPADEGIQAQLRKLLPHQSYEVEATGMLRTSAVAGNHMEIEMESFSQMATQYQLVMMIGSFDLESGSLGLDTCRFSVIGPAGKGNLFSTSTTIFRGEQAVLGVAGAEPLFLVVQVHPVSAAPAAS